MDTCHITLPSEKQKNVNIQSDSGCSQKKGGEFQVFDFIQCFYAVHLFHEMPQLVFFFIPAR